MASPWLVTLTLTGRACPHEFSAVGKVALGLCDRSTRESGRSKALSVSSQRNAWHDQAKQDAIPRPRKAAATRPWVPGAS